MGNTIACISETTSSSIALATTTIMSSSADYRSCQTFCTTGANSFPYSAFRNIYPNNDTTQTPTGVECACYDAVVQPLQYQPATDSYNDCADTDFSYESTTSTFSQVLCVSEPTDLSDYITVSSPAACYSRCAGQLYANIIPDSSLDTFYCQCSQTFRSADNTVNCDKDTLFSFYHENYPQSSGLARKRGLIRDTARKRALAKTKADTEFCPAGMSACAIPHSTGDEYECIDTQTELESCGGCIHGLFGLKQRRTVSAVGTDCTAVQGVPMGAMTCTEGQCVAMACEKGYALIEGQCQ